MRTLARFSLLALFALPPLSALAAASLIAGFPTSPIWLSEASITEGDTVRITTVVYDASGTAIAGDVDFLVDDASVGTAHFSLVSGQSALLSAEWKATAGSHTFTAEITGATDGSNALTLAAQKTSSMTAVVAKAPPPAAAVVALDSAAAAANSAATVAIPVVAQAAANVAQAAEGLRTSGATFLANQLAANAPSGAVKGSVLGAETYKAPAAAQGAAAGSSQSGFLSGFTRAIEGFLLIIFGNAWLFYPVFTVLLLILLYIVFRRLGRSRYS
ncbi:hypothetical protein KGQ55_01770 [Patescibacteria group bacterium]|nr:hypothetical protein [Patescibacteria group bacterium]